MSGDPLPFAIEVLLHLEAFYRHPINDNISITPGTIWLAAPNQTNEHDDAVIATRSSQRSGHHNALVIPCPRFQRL